MLHDDSLPLQGSRFSARTSSAVIDSRPLRSRSVSHWPMRAAAPALSSVNSGNASKEMGSGVESVGVSKSTIPVSIARTMQRCHASSDPGMTLRRR